MDCCLAETMSRSKSFSCLYFHTCETKTTESRCLWGVSLRKQVLFPSSLPWWDGFLSWGTGSGSRHLVVAEMTWQMNVSLEFFHFCDTYMWFLFHPQFILYTGDMQSLRFLLPSYGHILGLGSLGSDFQVFTTEWIMPDTLSTLSADNTLRCRRN